MAVRGRPRWVTRSWQVASTATIVLVTSAIVLTTGVVLYWLRTGLPPLWAGRLVLAVHVYVGLFALPFVAVKLWLTWDRFLRLAPHEVVARLDLWAARALVVLVVAVNATGLQLQYQWPPASKSTMALVHLVLTYLLLVPILWHVQRYLATTLRWLVAPGVPRRVDPNARARRRMVWGGAALVGGLVLFRLPAGLAALKGDRGGMTAIDAGADDAAVAIAAAPGTGGAAAAIGAVSTGEPATGRVGTNGGPLEAGERPTVGGSTDASSRAGVPALTPPSAAAANDFPVTGHRLDFAAIDPKDWRLRIVGAVERPRTFTHDDLLAMPSVRFSYPLECPLSFEVVRQWTGVPLKELLELAAPAADFGLVVAKSDDGFDSTLRRAELDRPSVMVCTHVNGVPLNEEHGFPMRLMVPGGAGERCVKWLQELEVKVHA